MVLKVKAVKSYLSHIHEESSSHTKIKCVCVCVGPGATTSPQQSLSLVPFNTQSSREHSHLAFLPSRGNPMNTSYVKELSGTRS